MKKNAMLVRACRTRWNVRNRRWPCSPLFPFSTTTSSSSSSPTLSTGAVEVFDRHAKGLQRDACARARAEMLLNGGSPDDGYEYLREEVVRSIALPSSSLPLSFFPSPFPFLSLFFFTQISFSFQRLQGSSAK